MLWCLSGVLVTNALFWWLRSPGENPNNAVNVNNDGEMNVNGNNVNNDNGGVRPALTPRLIPKPCVQAVKVCDLEPKESNPLYLETNGKHMPMEMRDAKICAFSCMGGRWVPSPPPSVAFYFYSLCLIMIVYMTF